MVLPTTGPISLANLQEEFGGTNPASIFEYYRGGPYVLNVSDNASIPTSGTISLSNFYGRQRIAPRSFSLRAISSGTSGTFSLANAPDPYRWLICTQANFSSNAIAVRPPPVINGVSMTSIATQRSDFSSDGHIAGISAINITSGTTVSWTASSAGVNNLAFYEVTGIVNPIANAITSTTASITVPSLPAFVVGTAVTNFTNLGGPTSITGLTNAFKNDATLTAYTEAAAALTNTYTVVSSDSVIIQLKAAFVFNW